MNARQKAKRFKRLYEGLLKEPVKFTVEHHKIDRLKFERHYPTALVTQENSNYFREVVHRDIALCLAESLEKYIDYHTEFCPYTDDYRICGEIKVVSNL